MAKHVAAIRNPQADAYRLPTVARHAAPAAPKFVVSRDIWATPQDIKLQRSLFDIEQQTKKEA